MYFLDEDARLMFNKVDEDLPGVEIAFVSENKAEDKFMVRTYSDKTWGSYYFYDKTIGELSKIAEVSPWIEADNMAEVDVGRRRVSAVFDTQTAPLFGGDLQFFLQFVSGKEIHMPGGQNFKLFF